MYEYHCRIRAAFDPGSRLEMASRSTINDSLCEEMPDKGHNPGHAALSLTLMQRDN